MRKDISRWLAVGAVAAAALAATFAQAAEERLDEATLKSVRTALADERRTEAEYHRVLGELGSVRPFSNAAWAEGRHAALLEDILRAHGADVPAAAAPPGAAASFATLKDACAAAVEGEKRNIALYDAALVPGLPADVARVFEHNRMASREHHLPAFERCAGFGGGAAAAGPGSGGRGCGCGGRRAGCPGPQASR